MSPASEGEVRLLAALPLDGSFIGNGKVRSAIGMAPEAYSVRAHSLRRAGLITVGRERGGSVAITERGRGLLTRG